MWYKENNKVRKGQAQIKNLKQLENKNYLLQYSEFEGYFLIEQEDFILPTKIYGNENEFAKKVIHTFGQSDRNTGVFLVGNKGTGKSLTAKIIAKASNLPVIIITQNYSDDAFISFLSDLKQEVVPFVDEFEKVYKNEEQEVYLSILDGILSTKKLFLFTSNSFDVETNLKSRPSRVRYLRKYNGLSKEVIDEIIDTELVDKTNKQSVIEVCNILSEVSMDVLLTLIDEMNVYKISAQEAVKDLNIQVEFSEFDVLMIADGRRSNTKVWFNPLTREEFTLEYRDKDGMWRWKTIKMKDMDIKFVGEKYHIDTKDGNEHYVFTPSKGFEFNL